MVGTVNDIADLESKNDKTLTREDLEKVITLLADSINKYSTRDQSKVYPAKEEEKIASMFRAYERFQNEYRIRYNSEYTMKGGQKHDNNTKCV